MVKHILTPTDGSDLATQAVDQGIALAAGMGAAVTVMTVTSPSTSSAPTRCRWKARAPAMKLMPPPMPNGCWRPRAKGQVAGVSIQKTHHKWHDSPCEAIIEAAWGEGCDLIAMASHGQRGMAAVVIGSQATRILTHSKIPVLVYR